MVFSIAEVRKMKTKKTLLIVLTVLWVFLILVNPMLGVFGGNKILRSRRPFNFLYDAVRGLRSATMFFLIVINIFLVLGLREDYGKKHLFRQ
jgi:hypothetical protein